MNLLVGSAIFMADTQFKNLVIINSWSRPMSVVGTTTAEKICSVRVFRILIQLGHSHKNLVFLQFRRPLFACRLSNR
jgi:hypothetical protein